MLNFRLRGEELQGKLHTRVEYAPTLARVPASWRMPLLCHDILAMCLLLAARLRAVMTARSCTPLLINQPHVFPHAPLIQPLRACAPADRSRGSRSLLCTNICLCVRVCMRMLCVLPLIPRQAFSIMSR